MCEVLELSDDIHRVVARSFDRTEESLQEDVAILKEWIKTQPHLPEVTEDAYIRNFLLLNKCSIEKTKQNIDMYYTTKTLMWDIYQYSTATKEEWRSLTEACLYLPLPKLTKENYRVTITKIVDDQAFESVSAYQMLAYVYNTYEIRLKEDCMFSDLVFCDLGGTSLNTITKFTPSVLAKSVFINEKVFSSRIKGVYMLNSPSFISVLLGVFKAVLKPKIFNRIHICTDTSLLHEVLPAEIIPKDYGGQGKSLNEIQELWLQKFEQYEDRFKELITTKVNEDLRPEKLKNDELLGFHGNFKKLNVD